MIEPDHPQLSIGRQCQQLSIARSSFHSAPKGETGQNLDLMRLIDELLLETPFFGVRQMTWHQSNDGHLVNEKPIRRLMHPMGLMPLYQTPYTCRPAKGRKTYPYPRKGLRGERPNQVWYSDITKVMQEARPHLREVFILALTTLQRQGDCLTMPVLLALVGRGHG